VFLRLTIASLLSPLLPALIACARGPSLKEFLITYSFAMGLLLIVGLPTGAYYHVERGWPRFPAALFGGLLAGAVFGMMAEANRSLVSVVTTSLLAGGVGVIMGVAFWLTLKFLDALLDRTDVASP
jgi:hypothetical protein